MRWAASRRRPRKIRSSRSDSQGPDRRPCERRELSEHDVSSAIEGIELKVLDVLMDDRGSFLELYRQGWSPGFPGSVQANLSRSRRGVVRGMHFHRRQIDLWVPLEGRMFVGLFDLRPDPSTGAVGLTLELDADAPRALVIPTGVAHGFQALTDVALLYLVSRAHDGTDEHGFRYDDPELGFAWPLPDPVVSERDRSAPPLSEVLQGEGYIGPPAG